MWYKKFKIHVQTAREFHDLNMGFVVLTRLLVHSRIASNSYVHRILCKNQPSHSRCLFSIRCPYEDTLHIYSPKMHPVRITKTRLYSFDPLKPYFYTVKLGFTGVYIDFSYFFPKHRLWVLVRTASPRRFLRVPQSMFWAEIWKLPGIFHLKVFIVWW